PAPAAGRGGPCRGLACGCATVEECQRSCCCSHAAPAQPPPRSRPPASAKSTSAPGARASHPGGKSCCSSPGATTRPNSRSEPRCPSCGQKVGSCCHDTVPPADEPKPQDAPPGPGDAVEDAADDPESDGGKARWVHAVSAMKCRGHSTLWVSTGVALPQALP